MNFFATHPILVANPVKVAKSVIGRHLLLKEYEKARMMIVLVVILHLDLWCLPPQGLPLQGLDLRIALNLLSPSFPLSLFCCIQQAFCQLRHALGLYLVLSYFII